MPLYICVNNHLVDMQMFVFCDSRWPEIARLTQNKKIFELDTSKSSAQFQMVGVHFLFMHVLGLRCFKSDGGCLMGRWGNSDSSHLW